MLRQFLTYYGVPTAILKSRILEGRDRQYEDSKTLQLISVDPDWGARLRMSMAREPEFQSFVTTRKRCRIELPAFGVSMQPHNG